MPEKRFMEAVMEKAAKRQPVLKRKPGMSVMIAVGAPKSAPKEAPKAEEEEAPVMGTSKAERIARLQAKIASLKAELAFLEDEEEMEDVEEEAYEEDAEMDDEEED